MSHVSARAVAVVPAAGRSERFGAMKLLADVRGEPLLNHTLRCLLDAAVDGITVVTSPAVPLDAVPLLRHRLVRTVVNPDPSRGMFSSIQAGLAEADASVILVLPADMPFVAAATVKATLAECQQSQRAIVPTFRGRHGHPLALPGRYRSALLAMDASSNLKDALRLIAGEAHEFQVEDAGVVRDVDLPADLSRPDPS
jgi:molybdenum cofactor cytidylyltransferase